MTVYQPEPDEAPPWWSPTLIGCEIIITESYSQPLVTDNPAIRPALEAWAEYPGFSAAHMREIEHFLDDSTYAEMSADPNEAFLTHLWISAEMVDNSQSIVFACYSQAAIEVAQESAQESAALTMAATSLVTPNGQADFDKLFSEISEESKRRWLELARAHLLDFTVGVYVKFKEDVDYQNSIHGPAEIASTMQQSASPFGDESTKSWNKVKDWELLTPKGDVSFADRHEASSSANWAVSFSFVLPQKKVTGTVRWDRLTELYGRIHAWPSPGLRVGLDDRLGLRLVCDEKGKPSLSCDPRMFKEAAETTNRTRGELYEGLYQDVQYHRIGQTILLAPPDSDELRLASALAELLRVCCPDDEYVRGNVFLSNGASRLRLEPPDAETRKYVRNRDRQIVHRDNGSTSKRKARRAPMPDRQSAPTVSRPAPTSPYTGPVTVKVYGPQGKIWQSQDLLDFAYLVTALRSCGAREEADRLARVTTTQEAIDLTPALTFDGTTRPAGLIVSFTPAYMAENATLFKGLGEKTPVAFVRCGDLIVLLPKKGRDEGGWLLRFLHPEWGGTFTKRSRTLGRLTLHDRVEVTVTHTEDRQAFTTYLKSAARSKRKPIYTQLDEGHAAFAESRLKRQDAPGPDQVPQQQVRNQPDPEGRRVRWLDQQ
ncbi:hypothetical protein ACFYPT_37730 [Streptomyces sp. NPDC005529]|uniref:hypothetical protein n=1 Tax=unclassified Streptomyces TaxID=2593676 RepID=UPI0033BC2C20